MLLIEDEPDSREVIARLPQRYAGRGGRPGQPQKEPQMLPRGRRVGDADSPYRAPNRPWTPVQEVVGSHLVA